VRNLAFVLLLCCAADAEDLLLNRQQAPPKTVVYEVPGLPGAFTARLRDSLHQNLPQAELFDAADPDLRSKITGPFLLLTMLDPASRLLALAANPLPLKLEGGLLHWDGFSGRARELRIRFVGKNPFAAGTIAVFAFGAPEMMQGSAGGNYSYAIENASGILRKGTYDTDFAPTHAGGLSYADALADARELFTTIERVHVDLFARTTENDYRRIKEQTLAALAGKDGQASMEQFFSLLGYAVASIRDGHTNLFWSVRPIDEVNADRKFPPFLLDSENGRFFVYSAKDKSLVGAELLAINGTPAADFLRPVLNRISGETLAWRAAQFAGEQTFWLWLTNLFGAPGCCKLKIGGTGNELAVEPIGFREFMQLERRPPRVTHGPEVRFFDSGRIAHFIYPAFLQTNAEKKRIEDIFRDIRAEKSEHLIIDLRANGGGDSRMGDYIFRYISSQPVDQESHMRARISQEAIDDWKKNGGKIPPMAEPLIATLLGKTLDTAEEPLKSIYRLFTSQEQPDPAPEAPFRGKLWLLIDNQTFSSANMFTAAFRDYKLGKILGYESGEPAIACGNPFSFKLPHSGLGYRVSGLEFFPNQPQPGDDVHGILPDIAFDRTLLAPYREQADPGLAFTLDVIRKQTAASAGRVP
jgi:hypothetical protein